MARRLFTICTTTLLLLQTIFALPLPQSDYDSYGSGASGSNGADYNTIMGHFKDFFLYLPVMMTTLKETMTGFPKFAEGMRILTSKSGRLDEECKCKGGGGGGGLDGASNEIDNSSHYSEKY